MTTQCLEQCSPTMTARGRERKQAGMTATQRPEEFYSISEAESQRTYVGGRRAAQWVGFLLPHLRPGLSVLDCGCGVGSITLDIAELTAPGPVVGIDRDESQLAFARQAAIQRGLSNATFQQGSIHALPFADGTFDVVLAHTLLFHLRDPLSALVAMRRALRPGGVAAISDDDYRTVTYSPDDPMMQRILDLWVRVVEHNGGNPYYSRHLRSLLLEAGFLRTEGFAVAADHYGTQEETRRFARIMGGLLRGQALFALVARQGWATPGELDEMVAWLARWGERPDAFFSITYCAALGWTG